VHQRGAATQSTGWRESEFERAREEIMKSRAAVGARFASFSGKFACNFCFLWHV
jgi:hypothetical protein